MQEEIEPRKAVMRGRPKIINKGPISRIFVEVPVYVRDAFIELGSDQFRSYNGQMAFILKEYADNYLKEKKGK